MSAKINSAYCWGQLGDKWVALQEILSAQLVHPEDPRAYYTAAAIWGEMGHWDNVITYVKLGDQFRMKDTLHAVDPLTLSYQPALALTQAYREKNMPEAALQAAQRLMQASRDPGTLQLVEDLKKWANAEMYSTQILRTLQLSDNPHKAVKHFNLSPHMMDRGIAIQEEESPGASEDKKTIAFYCGQSATRWGPPSQEKGVGASEKMVYEAARRLVRKGFNVQVYCRLNRPEGVCEEGINWYYSGRFNPRIFRDIVII